MGVPRTDLNNDEDDWLLGCLEGNRRSQHDAFRHLLPILRGVVRRYTWNESDVQDILQEAFIRIFKSINQFDKTKGSFTSWSKRIAINTAINEGKKRMRHKIMEHDLPVPIEPDVIHKMGLDDLVQALTAMPTDQHRVFNLHLVDGFSHKEIGEMLNITPDVSRQRLSKARRWIKRRFELSGNDLVLKQNLQR